MIAEEVILWVFVVLLGFGNMAVKFIVQIAIIVLAFVMSTCFPDGPFGLTAILLFLALAIYSCFLKDVGNKVMTEIN